MGIGDDSMVCRLRHELMRFPIAVWVESWGGLAGGEMKRADWRRGCDGSQERADGSNIFDDAPSDSGESQWLGPGLEGWNCSCDSEQ